MRVTVRLRLRLRLRVRVRARARPNLVAPPALHAHLAHVLVLLALTVRLAQRERRQHGPRHLDMHLGRLGLVLRLGGSGLGREASLPCPLPRLGLGFGVAISRRTSSRASVRRLPNLSRSRTTR